MCGASEVISLDYRLWYNQLMSYRYSFLRKVLVLDYITKILSIHCPLLNGKIVLFPGTVAYRSSLVCTV